MRASLLLWLCQTVKSIHPHKRTKAAPLASISQTDFPNLQVALIASVPFLRLPLI
jgi:hypothetical protein